MDIHGDDHRSLIRHACHGKANQLFRMDNRSNAIRQDGRCLDVAGGETRDGSRVILFQCSMEINSVVYTFRILDADKIGGFRRLSRMP